MIGLGARGGAEGEQTPIEALLQRAHFLQPLDILELQIADRTPVLRHVEVVLTLHRAIEFRAAVKPDVLRRSDRG